MLLESRGLESELRSFPFYLVDLDQAKTHVDHTHWYRRRMFSRPTLKSFLGLEAEPFLQGL